MDIAHTLEPNSDQLDAVDLIGGPRTFTIKEVKPGNAEQPVNIHLAEFPRPWRPGKSMRRVLAHCWGTDTTVYPGRRVTLYCDPDVRFGGQAVGGTRIKALSHIDKPRRIPLLVSRGKSATYIVEPLPDDAPPTPVDKITPEQTQQLGGLVSDHNLNRDEALSFAVSVVGHPLASAAALTRDEAQQVIDALAGE